MKYDHTDLKQQFVYGRGVQPVVRAFFSRNDL